jgi:hypothetical protein
VAAVVPDLEEASARMIQRGVKRFLRMRADPQAHRQNTRRHLFEATGRRGLPMYARLPILPPCRCCCPRWWRLCPVWPSCSRAVLSVPR